MFVVFHETSSFRGLVIDLVLVHSGLWCEHVAISHLSPKREFIRDGPNQKGHQTSGLVAFLLITGSLMTVWSRPKPYKLTNKKEPYDPFRLNGQQVYTFPTSNPNHQQPETECETVTVECCSNDV